MKKWKWQSRRSSRNTTRGKPRQTVKAKIRMMIPGEEDVLCDEDGRIPAGHTGRHHNALAA